MYIGIDLGTSAVKFVLVDPDQIVVASTQRSFATDRPKPGWSEQDPNIWIDSVASGLDELAAKHADRMAQVVGIGLSGQMHGAVLLDKFDTPVRPAILWNDCRASAEASELNLRHPDLVETAGIQAMPGFTGPKLLWLSRNEPKSLKDAKHLLFPKDYVRLMLSGDRATDVSDAAGSWLLDQQRRNWSEEAILACGADELDLPEAFEAAQATGNLRPSLAKRWGLPSGVTIAAGAGDVAAACVGIGAVADNHGLISLGTSAQVVVSTNSFAPRTQNSVHTFCHALPNTWLQMAALLNGTSVLDALSRWTGDTKVGSMISSVEKKYDGPGKLLALPYLSGERTPHNDSRIRGAIIGLRHSSSAEDITLAFLESIAFALADGLAALDLGQDRPAQMALVGGGSKSPFLAGLIASLLNIPVAKHTGAEFGPALGAARLARLASTKEEAAKVITPLPIQRVFEPNPDLHRQYLPRLKEYRQLYRALRTDFGAETK